jgi:hypothetical protein
MQMSRSVRTGAVALRVECTLAAYGSTGDSGASGATTTTSPEEHP